MIYLLKAWINHHKQHMNITCLLALAVAKASLFASSLTYVTSLVFIVKSSLLHAGG